MFLRYSDGFFSRLCVGYGGSLSHEPKFGFDINTISVITSFKSGFMVGCFGFLRVDYLETAIII
jgi:hypothetical protein